MQSTPQEESHSLAVRHLCCSKNGLSTRSERNKAYRIKVMRLLSMTPERSELQGYATLRGTLPAFLLVFSQCCSVMLEEDQERDLIARMCLTEPCVGGAAVQSDGKGSGAEVGGGNLRKAEDRHYRSADPHARAHEAEDLVVVLFIHRRRAAATRLASTARFQIPSVDCHI